MDNITDILVHLDQTELVDLAIIDEVVQLGGHHTWRMLL